MTPEQQAARDEFEDAAAHALEAGVPLVELQGSLDYQAERADAD